MANTDSSFTQDVGSSDFEITIGADNVANVVGNNDFGLTAYVGSAGSWVSHMMNVGSTGPGYFANITAALKRTGMSPDPDMVIGYPPFSTAQLPTLANPLASVPKGFKVNSLGVQYGAGGSNGLNLTVALFTVQFINNAVPIKKFLLNDTTSFTPPPSGTFTNYIIVPVNSGYIITPDTALYLQIFPNSWPTQFHFIGAVLKCTMNLN
jgi:hypothetical protein